MVIEYMDRAKIKSDGGTIRFRPTTRDVSALVTFLRSNVGLDDRITPRQSGSITGPHLRRRSYSVNPWQAFMDFYWEVDPTGKGTRCRVFYLAFKHWCLQTRRLDIMETSPSDLIQKINRLDDWEFLESFRPQDKTNKKRPWRYAVRLREDATLPDEILNTPEHTYE
jgi:hypothetical protein